MAHTWAHEYEDATERYGGTIIGSIADVQNPSAKPIFSLDSLCTVSSFRSAGFALNLG